MKHERLVVTGVLTVLVFGWLGFLIHRSSRFAGTGLALAFGIAGAALMVVPLAYTVIKRIAFLRTRITKHVSMQTLLALHVYIGILAPLLALVHTGHKYDSPLGVILTAAMLLVVVTGYALRYLLPYVRDDLRDKLALLQTARGDLDNAWGVLERSPAKARGLPKMPLLAAGAAAFGLTPGFDGPAARATNLAESVADLEYSVRTHEVLKRWFSRALKLHVAVSIAFYALLAMHIWSSIYFGLRGLK